MSVNLFPHQSRALAETADHNRVAYYHDMGLGKTYTGSEKLIRLGAKVNLVVCQKSKIVDWVDHFVNNYVDSLPYSKCRYTVFDLTKKNEFDTFVFCALENIHVIGIINYELVWRRPELLKLKDFTLMLDESSLIQNSGTNRTKFISKLQFTNLILLSGTPTGGKYENLYSQLKLLGYNISKTNYYNQYIEYHIDKRQGFPLMIIDGYKNVERLKRKMREYGCNFLKTEDVLDLPEQRFIPLNVDNSKEYRKFMKDRIVAIPVHHEVKTNDCGDISSYDGAIQLVGDTTLTKLLYARMLCGAYSTSKLGAFRDLVESTEDRLIVFYNFNHELDELEAIADMCKKPVSVVNGQFKELKEYEECDNSVTFIQYQAGAMGLNLQKANKIIYFTPPLSSELYEQSKKRIHRINQTSMCTYYNLIVRGSVEEKIYKTLDMRRDYTNALFESEEL